MEMNFTKEKKDRILKQMLCWALLLLGLSASMILYRDRAQGAFVTELNSAAEAFYTGMNAYLAETDADALPPDGIYCAAYRKSAHQIALKPYDKPVDAAFFEPKTLSLSEETLRKSVYFMLEIKDGTVKRVSACRRNLLTKRSLRPIKRETNPYQLTLSEFYFRTFIANYPR